MLIHQPHQGNLGDQLISAINSGCYNRLIIMCAYAKMSGVSRILQTLSNFRNNGGEIDLLIGVDQQNTTFEALRNLFSVANNLYIVHNQNHSHTFHHKSYMLDNPTDIFQAPWHAIGSNNLTAGGLFINYESCFIHNLDLSQQADYDMYTNTLNAYTYYINNQNGITIHINNENLIQDLFDNGYIVMEAQDAVPIRISPGQNPPIQNMFGSEYFATPPQQATPFPLTPQPLTALTNTPGQQPQITIPPQQQNINQTPATVPQALNEIFWFEMRASTGGSRNILDLSSTGGLQAGNPGIYAINENIVRGSVEFFDITPTSHDITKEITITYNGHNYYPSTILFAPNNGSWRLQLKGESTTDHNALSTYGRADFVGNILLFEKISMDHYLLTVCPADQLQALQNQSIFYATNGGGTNSKQYGRLQ